jgi:hypothetical protein
MKVKKQILSILKITEEQYNMNILDFSYDFLTQKDYPGPVIQILHQTQGYWAWWRNQFDIADLFFLSCCSLYGWDQGTLEFIRHAYKTTHITIKAYPSRLVEKIEIKIQRKNKTNHEE